MGEGGGGNRGDNQGEPGLCLKSGVEWSGGGFEDGGN